MQKLLDDSSTYEKIDLDPLQKSQNTIFKKLDEWRKLNLLGDKIERKDLITINTNLARMYGLPKVHKENWPLRPVVSYINTPSYFMAKFFNNILKSFPKPPSIIKISFEFISKIKNQNIPNHYTMMSLDVISLFTNIPLDLVLISIEKRWHYISKSTKLSLERFNLAIKILLEQTFFMFNHQFYRQTFGTPMGSPISPILADFVMQDLETDILKRIEFVIPVYFRYADDIFLLIPRDKIHYILTMFQLLLQKITIHI